MKYTFNPFKSLFFVTCLLISCFSFALSSYPSEQQSNNSIKELYHRVNHLQNSSVAARIDWCSNLFLGVPYLLGSLGEGEKALFDQFPLYRLDAFDCDTYVNTVLALALADSLPAFQQCIKNLRYKNGLVSYLQRNHFTGLDWNQNNQQNKILKDITLTIHDEKNQPVAQFAKALINKPSWYAFKNTDAIRLHNKDKVTSEKRLAMLKHKGNQLEVVQEQLPYLPFTVLFPEKNKPNMYLFKQIPNAAIIEIVRPNWDLRQKIGTALNISHLGFAIWKNGQLYFRQASSEYGKVVEVSLIEYLEKAVDSPTIRGINVQIVVPLKPLNHCNTNTST